MENKIAGLDVTLSERDGEIKSYVIRSGRMTDMQKKSMDKLYPIYGIKWQPDSKISSKSLFNNDSKLIIEIGFGMGQATIYIANKLKDTSFIGIDVHAPGVGKLLSEIENKNMKNLKVIRHDAVEFIDKMTEDSSIDGFHIFFPDPWPKKRHHKRRLMNESFISLLSKKLVPGGYIYYVTDWEEYALATLEVMTQEKTLKNNFDTWATKQEWRPTTKFEQRAIDEGRPIRELFFTKI